jgi:IclR family transcriptional regulator, acetate operon repressor
MSKSLDKGLHILAYLASKPEAGPSEISRDLKYGKSTVIRLLQTMESSGFVRQNSPVGHYEMGARVLELAHDFLEQQDDIVSPAVDEIRALWSTFSETVGLFVREGDSRVCVYSLQSPLALRHLVRVGQARSIASGASGKVLLAFMPSDEVEAMFAREGVEPQRASRLRLEFPRIRQEGVAFSLGEGQPGTAAVAAPILNGHRELMAVLFLTGPLERLTPARLQEMAGPLLIAAQTISGRMVV